MRQEDRRRSNRQAEDRDCGSQVKEDNTSEAASKNEGDESREREKFAKRLASTAVSIRQS